MENIYTSLKNKDIKQFDPIRDLNPKFYRIQRVRGIISGSTTLTRVQFTSDRLTPNALLYGYAYVDWSYSVERQRSDTEAPVIFPVGNQDVIYSKPFSMMNASSNVVMSINGFGIRYEQPHIWSRYVHAFTSTRAHMHKKFSTDGGPFPTYNGSYDDQALPQVAPDTGIQRAQNIAFNNYKQSVEDGLATATFSNVEPLMLGLFNPYESKHDLPRRSWYKNNSWLIPHVDKFEMSVEMTRIARNTLVYMYALAPAPVVMRLFDLGLTNADLYLTWISPSAGYQIPRQVTLQSWNIDLRKLEVNGGVVVVREQQVTFESGILRLYQIPSSILLFATSTQLGRSCRAIVNDTDGAGTNQTVAIINNCMDQNMGMDNVVIRSNINNQTIDASFTRQQLYAITEKNCKEMPYDFSSWVGGSRQYSLTPGNTFLYLYPDDLNIAVSPGVPQDNFTFEFAMDLTAYPGNSFGSGDFGVPIQLVYEFYVVFFFDNYFITLNKNGRVSARYLANAI